VVVDGDAAAGVPLHQPRSVEGGDQEAVGWRMEDSQILRSLMESMPKRLLEVIVRCGNTTRY
jgi:hypothetical protein